MENLGGDHSAFGVFSFEPAEIPLAGALAGVEGKVLSDASGDNSVTQRKTRVILSTPCPVPITVSCGLQ